MKAYLAWPLKLQGYNLHDHHITLKYLGTIGTPSGVAEAVLKRLIAPTAQGKKNIQQLNLSNATWKAARFHSVNVMVLTGLNLEAHLYHTRCSDMRRDDYPNWAPHITVSNDTAAFIAYHEVKANDLIECAGALTLYVNKKPFCAFIDQEIVYL